MHDISIWHKSAALPRFSPLSGDRQVHAAIIGGGITGLLTAHLLREKGIHALVLEANRLCSGQTGRTTAKVTSQHDLIYADLIDCIGEDAAAQYARANEEAIAEYGRIIREGRINCGFTPCDAYLYSTAESAVLEKEAQAAKKLGIRAAFTRESELPFPVAGALRFSGQARMHPLRLLVAIVPGLDICEETRVLAVEDDRILTDTGTVQAEHIVFACHYPFVNVPGWYFARMHQERSYVLALENAWLPRHVHLGVDGDGLSFREAEGMLLLGGGSHRTGENRGGGKYDLLRNKARALFPGSREVACWSAQDCVTADRIPCIGQYARSRPRWYAATGFAKWGMTTAMAAARIISGLICGDVPEWAGVFSPQRPVIRPETIGPLMNETGHALRGLIRVTPAPRCTHLGCELTWNPDEDSWDCPCHGSRFSADGMPLDGPAREKLACREHPEDEEP